MPNVLVLDTDNLSNMVLLHRLEELGMPCSFLAKSAVDALSLFQAGLSIDLLIADWQTPGVCDLLQAIKKIGQDPLVVFSVPEVQTESEPCTDVCCKPYTYGAVGVMLKPYRRQAVTRKLKSIQRLLTQRNRARKEKPTDLFMPAVLQGRLA